MNRRAFLSALGLAGVPVAILSTAHETNPPVAHVAAYCSCGAAMQIVTRRWEKSHANDPVVWSCGFCRRSWRIPYQALNSSEVAYDDGTR